MTQGAQELTQGVQELTQGVQELTQGAQELTQGVQELTQGAQELTQGAQEFTQGAQELTQGAQESTQGVQELTQGVPLLWSNAVPLHPNRLRQVTLVILNNTLKVTFQYHHITKRHARTSMSPHLRIVPGTAAISANVNVCEGQGYRLRLLHRYCPHTLPILLIWAGVVGGGDDTLRCCQCCPTPP